MNHPSRVRPVLLGSVVLLIATLVSGCAPGAEAVPGASAPLVTETAVPVPRPGSTVAPQPGTIPAGVSLAVVATPETPRAVVDAFVAAHSATVTVYESASRADVEARLDEAIALGSDVIVSFGSMGLDALDRASASNLAQQFLVIGAQLPEPTENVTAVIWAGADVRDGQLEHTPALLAENTPAALEAGVASVLLGRTGFVIDLGL